MQTYKYSASIILTRGPDDNPEVYLARRAPKIKIFGDFWVFPGGNVSEIDCHREDDTLEQVFARCAIREAFEECQILSATLGKSFSSDEKQKLKNTLTQSPDSWKSFISDFDQNFKQLIPVFRISTPPFTPLRYDTQFMHVRAVDDEVPSIDNYELVEDCFIKPAAAINAWLKGKMKIAPPVLQMLKLLDEKKLSGFYELTASASEALQQGDLHQIYFSPGIFIAPLLTDTIPPATTTNTLIVGTENLYIVDPATPDEREQQRLFKQLDQLLGNGCKLKAILLTHHHPDHVAAVNALSQRYQLPVRAHELCYPRIAKGFIKGDALKDGDILELGTAPDGTKGWQLTVLHTPGHAVDHLCFIENRYQSAIVGDMLSTVSTILINPPEGHMQTYLNSLHRLLACNIKALYPAHGPAKSDGAGLIKYYIKHRADREQETLSALTKTPQTIEQILPSVYNDVPESVYPIAKRSLLAELIKLEEEDRCYQCKQGWKLA